MQPIYHQHRIQFKLSLRRDECTYIQAEIGFILKTEGRILFQTLIFRVLYIRQILEIVYSQKKY